MVVAARTLVAVVRRTLVLVGLLGRTGEEVLGRRVVVGEEQDIVEEQARIVVVARTVVAVGVVRKLVEVGACCIAVVVAVGVVERTVGVVVLGYTMVVGHHSFVGVGMPEEEGLERPVLRQCTLE